MIWAFLDAWHAGFTKAWLGSLVKAPFDLVERARLGYVSAVFTMAIQEE